MRPCFVLPLLLLASFPAFAQAPSLPKAPPTDETDEPEEVPPSEDPQTRIEDLEDKLYELEKRLEQVETGEELDIPIVFHGYADFGFFAPIGNNGVGWIQDLGNQISPQNAGRFGWVFLGDILATSVNSRGEAADLGDAPGVQRFDGINSGGALGFILNEVNFRMSVGLGSSVKLTTSLNFTPRTGSEFSLGDLFDLDIAQAEWIALDGKNNWPKLSLFAGKVGSVFGIEYKERKSDQRFGLTPSLVQRYTSGTQLGLKARGKLFNDWLIVALAFTNGTFTTEQFHFYNEIDSNSGKTISGRVSVRIPVGELIPALSSHTLEIGFSGLFGPQDRARDNQGEIWFVGVDMEYRGVDFALKGQWIRGKSPGRPIDSAWALDLNNSGYLEFQWMFLPWLGTTLRGGVRDALVSLSNERLYITKSWRVTAGLRLVLNHHILFKAEYLHNGEFGEVPEFLNDIFTSSLVLRY